MAYQWHAVGIDGIASESTRVQGRPARHSVPCGCSSNRVPMLRCNLPQWMDQNATSPCLLSSNSSGTVYGTKTLPSVLPIFPLIRPICFPLFLARPQIFVALPFFPPRLVPVHVPALQRLKTAAVHVTLSFCRFLLLTGTLPGNFIFCALPISNE